MGSGATPLRVLMEVQNSTPLDAPRTPRIRRHVLPKGSASAISPLSSPVSPMANLKLLTKVASVFSEQRDRRLNSIAVERPFENEIVFPDLTTSDRRTDDRLPGSEKYSRRLRSLSFICNKFLEIYRLDLPQGKSELISLVSLSDRLGIKKRRVYDIINVVASLNLAVKVCKDRYRWFGEQNLYSSLANLKTYALENNFHVQLNEMLLNAPELNWTLGKRNINNNNNNENCPNSSCGGEEKFLKELNAGTKPPFDHNRIGVLCQKFVMLFLVAESGTSLSLLLLSKLILSSDIQYKTGVRRLYDVANALEALGLIAKSDDPTTRRPSFIYKGPRVESVNVLKRNELDCSQDTSIDHLLEIEYSEGGNRTYLSKNSTDDKPPAKKRLIFRADDKWNQSTTQVTSNSNDSTSPQNNAKTIVLPSLSSRLLGDEEAAFYRAKLNAAQVRPTFVLVRSPNQFPIRLN